jgi:hypothetical protein
MIRHDGRSNGRGKAQPLTYMPVVRSSVVDRGEWGNVRGLVAGDYGAATATNGEEPAEESLEELPIPELEDVADERAALLPEAPIEPEQVALHGEELAELEASIPVVTVERPSQTRINDVLDALLDQGDPERACALYVRIREAHGDIAFREATLARTIAAAGRISEGNVVVDATKVLMQAYPASIHVPDALLETARSQRAAGVFDLMERTLTYLAQAFPEHEHGQMARSVLAQRAKR